MPWYYNNVRIFVQEETGENEQLVAKLNPLGGGAIYHDFGYDYLVKNISAYIVGLSDLVNLRNCTTSGVAYSLETPWSTANYILKKLSTETQSWICQNLRPDLDSDAPVYLVGMELWHDP